MVLKRRASLNASSSVGLYLLFSMAFIVWRVTPTRLATSSCVSPSASRSDWMRLFIVLLSAFLCQKSLISR